MDKIWHRGVIRYLQKKGLTTKEIHANMVSTLGDYAPALSTVKKWAVEFMRGRESLEDDPRSERPSTATTQEHIDRIHQMVMKDRRLTISHLANVISISRERVENILHNELGMSKVSARWVPRLLTPDQKLTKLVMSETNLARFEADPDRFVLFYLPYLSSIHEKANCIAILWTVSSHSLGSCLFRGLWATCLPHKGGASR